MMKTVFIFLAALPLTVLAQKGFELKGTMTNLPDKSVVFATDMQNPTDTLAKTISSKGTFVLKGKLTEPALYHINFGATAKKALLFLENSSMTLTGDVNAIQKVKLTGSASQKDFEQFQSTFNPLFQQYTNLNQQAMQSGMTDSLNLAIIKTTREIENNIDAFVKDKPASYVTPFMLLVTSQLSQDVTVLEQRFNKLDKSVQQGSYGTYLNQMIADGKFGAVGTKAIEFTQNNTEGVPVSLSSLRGKYVLIDFWASWCGPCRKENPNVVVAYEKFRNKNFTVLGVSLDKNKESWLQAIKDDQLTWTHVSDLKYWQNEVAQQYKIQSIPQNYLIDPNGIIVGKNLRGEELTAKLCELLGCN